MHAVWVWGLIALVTALIALVLFFVRLRTLSARVGAFECALAVKSGWMGGMAWADSAAPRAGGYV